ncbi:HEAT repeat domain-containing protein [Streptomyces sp. NPDC059564]|uniref:HEAT repeat domain-containing protein n=1 Tax=Streptomyces sp. NPDC059564 TaxID=3346865 RepID=UPI0036AB72E4
MRSENHPGTGPWQTYGAFLRAQAEEAGMGARAIAEAFKATQHPDDGTACSRSQIDRLFNGQARPRPPVPFTLRFLRITGQAARLTQQEHHRRCDEALSLLRAATAKPSPPAGDDTAGVLRLERDLARVERDLARALHAETRLRYALRDAELLLSTLLRITGALREIIAGNDVRALRGTDPRDLARLGDETRRALTHKTMARQEADRVTERMRVLEGLWDRARAEIQRLALHSDAAALTLPHPSPSGPSHPVPADELFTQPALDDIAAALTKAHEVNTREEEAVQELHRAFTEDDGFLTPDDELAVLLASTRFTDPSSRQSAIADLASTWHQADAARKAVIRLTADPDANVRQSAADGLVAGWPHDAEARDALLRLAGDQDPDVRFCVAVALRHGWRDDSTVWATILRLADDSAWHVRHPAAWALAEGWPGNPTARDAVLRLVPHREVFLRRDATRMLSSGWPGDPAAREVIVRLTQDPETEVRRYAVQALWQGWSGDSAARDAVVGLAHDAQNIVRANVVRALVKGWPGDTVARDAVLRLANDPDGQVHPLVADALVEGWPGDPAAEAALHRLAADGTA